jgi:hypothetical protein
MHAVPTLLFLSLFVLPSVHGQTRVNTADITHFWEAYDHIYATKDTAEQRLLLHTHFIDKASEGQRAMFQARRYTPDEYLHAIRSYPRFWASVRKNMMSAEIHVQAMQDGVERLRVLYPQMRPADIHFTVGVFRSGGTVTDGMVLIGSEISLADSSAVTDEFPEHLGHLPGFFATNPAKDLAFVNVHELIHTQQPGRWGYDLLSQTLHEGIAEFIPTLAMGRPSRAASVFYGEANSDRVRAVFEEELFAFWIDRWIWNDTTGPFPVRDMGYYVGYAMAQQYYERADDKQQAIAELIGLNCEDREAVEAFAVRTGWLSRPITELHSNFEAARPRVTGIAEFDNGSTVVNPTTKTITLQFDRPMATAYRSTGLGPLGDAAAIDVKDIHFSGDGRSVTYEVKLTPGTHYQLVLEEGYRDERLFQLVPYSVDFRTHEL